MIGPKNRKKEMDSHKQLSLFSRALRNLTHGPDINTLIGASFVGRTILSTLDTSHDAYLANPSVEDAEFRKELLSGILKTLDMTTSRGRNKANLLRKDERYLPYKSNGDMQFRLASLNEAKLVCIRPLCVVLDSLATVCGNKIKELKIEPPKVGDGTPEDPVVTADKLKEQMETIKVFMSVCTEIKRASESPYMTLAHKVLKSLTHDDILAAYAEYTSQQIPTIVLPVAPVEP
jgi:hypothetical protein